MKKVRCRKCDTLKKKEDFVKDRLRPYGIFPWCKACHISSQKRYKETVAEYGESENKCPTCQKGMVNIHFNRVFCSDKCKGRAGRLREYGLSPEDFRIITASGKCPLCGCNVTKWAIDHNHETGETTGAICHRCNQYLLAGVKHSVEIAKNLLSYLENTPVKTMLGERRFVGPKAASQAHRIWLWADANKRQERK